MIIEKVNTKTSNLKSSDGKNIIVPLIDRLEHRVFNAMLKWKVIRKILQNLLSPSMIKEMVDSQLYNNNLPDFEKKPAIAIADRMISNIITKYMPQAFNLKNILDKILQCNGYVIKVVMEVNGLKKVDCIEYTDGVLIHNGSYYIEK